MAESKYYLNEKRLEYLIQKLKVWVITKVGSWWSLMRLSHNDSNKTQWEFKAGLDTNADPDTNGEFSKVPKLWLNSNDWMYSKWSETTSENWFPFTCAPAQYENIKDGGKYQSYYFNTIQVQPSTGSIKANGTIYAAGYEKTDGNSDELLLANGDTQKIKKLITTEVPVTNYGIAKLLEAHNGLIYFGIEQDEYQKMVGGSVANDMCFFQTMDEGLVFKKVNFSKTNKYPRFIATYFINSKEYGRIVAWATPLSASTTYNYVIGFSNSIKDFDSTPISLGAFDASGSDSFKFGNNVTIQ